MLLLWLSGCLQPAPYPDVGSCADYPQDGPYEYGQIDIGTCLSGPVELGWYEGEVGTELLVTNANPWRVFTGGSLLALPWEELQARIPEGRTPVAELDARALDLPDFAGGLAIAEDRALVAVRSSETARTRVHFDDVQVVSLPIAGEPDDVESKVEVQSDPVDIVYDRTDGRAYVANRTSHSISVLDALASPVEVVLPWPERGIGRARFDDADRSGSRTEFSSLRQYYGDLLTDDTWTLSWVEGSWRLWVPASRGVYRWTTSGDGAYESSGLGRELDPTGVRESLDLEEVTDPFYVGGTSGRMLFADRGTIRAAASGGWVGDWGFEPLGLLEGEDGAWDEELGGPAVVVDDEIWYLYYDGSDSDGQAIGLATSTDGYSFTRQGRVVKVDEDADEGRGERVADPNVVWDAETDRWRMFHGSYDGERWTIWEAWSADLLEWTRGGEPAFQVDGVDVAAPVVSVDTGLWKMWYARREGETWSIGAAESRDSETWTDLGTALETDLDGDEPPGPALGATVSSAFSVSGESASHLLVPMVPGEDYQTSSGWSARLVAGFRAGTRAGGARTRGGVRVDSVDPDAGMAWLSAWNKGGTARILVADGVVATGGDLDVRDETALEPGSGFDQDGVHSPVVVQDPDGGLYRMFYAGVSGDLTSIGMATSTDGSTWERQGEVLGPGDEWDSVAVEPGSVETPAADRDTWRLWYGGSDGEVWRIGLAESDDGVDWNRVSGEKGWTFPPGAPGDWDDSGVRHPFVVTEEDAEDGPIQHLWFSGYDGDLWRIGYAWRESDESDWTRSANEATDETRPVVAETLGLFHPDGVERPVAIPSEDGWTVWYSGLDGDTARVGLAAGTEPDRLHRLPARPTLGDTLAFTTEKGDQDELAIPLDQVVDNLDFATTGVIGLSGLLLDDERGYLYALPKMLPYVFVVDVRDDTTDSFADLNYLDIEAIVRIEAAPTTGTVGPRAAVLVPGTDLLYLLMHAPEGVAVMDLSQVPDDEYADFLTGLQVGWLPAPRGGERDAGVDTETTVGPGGIALHPDGRHLFVTHFNANALLVYDLALGTYGTLVADESLLGENPFAVLLTPDGRFAVVANYSGEVVPGGLASSTLAVLDADPESDSFLEVLTWVVND